MEWYVVITYENTIELREVLYKRNAFIIFNNVTADGRVWANKLKRGSNNNNSKKFILNFSRI